MNWFLKILLLLAALAGFVLGVAYFAKSIVQPPMQTEFDNLHLICLHDDVMSLEQHPTSSRADSVFDYTLHAARFWSGEQLISIGESDTIIEELVNKYTPIFLRSAREYFEGASWSEKKNVALNERAHLLKGLRHQTTRKYTLDGDLRIQVDSVKIIIGTYNDAKKLAENTGFVSLDDSRSKIETAKDYAKCVYFKNCTSLIRALIDELPQKLESNHFKHLQERVNSLASCYDRSTFNDVAQEIKEYSDYANDVYGTSHTSHDLDILKDKADLYFELNSPS